MAESVHLKFGQGIQASSGDWYSILQRLGAGGNAATFLVVATSGDSKGVPFAAKVFRRLSKSERRESFLAEVQFLKTRSHPSIMRVFDEGVLLDRHPFVIAEYLPSTLRTIIRSGNASLAEKTSFTVQLLSALDFLARLPRPVIHRDIKPENVFVKGFSCVLGDFGLIKLVDAEDADDLAVLKESIGVGMPAGYRTPDLVRYLRDGTRPTCKSDVYQLGLIVAELFTGRNPQKPAQSFTDPVVLDPVRDITGPNGSSIANLINSMLVTDPDQRDSAATFLAAWLGLFQAEAHRACNRTKRVFG